MKRHIPNLILLISLVLSSQLFAQNGGGAGAFLRLGMGPRGMGMRNGLSSVPEFGAIGFYNPALVAGANRYVELGSSAMEFDRSLHTILATFRIPPKAGLQFSLMNASVNNIDGRTLSGYPTRTFATNDYLIQTSFGVQSDKNLWLGASVKFLISDYHPDLPNSNAFGIDVGLYYKFSSELNFSFAIKDLLLTHQWNSSALYSGENQADQFNYFPTQIIIGSSYRFLESKLIVASDVIFRVYESTYQRNALINDFNPPISFTERVDVTSTSTAINVGATYQVHERFRISSGYSNRDLSYADSHHSFSSGFSLYLPFDMYAPSIDYSITSEPSVGTFIHTFSFKFNL